MNFLSNEVNITGLKKFMINIAGRRIILPNQVGDILQTSLATLDLTGIQGTIIDKDVLVAMLATMDLTGQAMSLGGSDVLQGTLATLGLTGIQGFIGSNDILTGILHEIELTGLQNVITSNDLIVGTLHEMPLVGLPMGIVDGDVLAASLATLDLTGIEAQILTRDLLQAILATMDITGIECTIVEGVAAGQLTTNLVAMWDFSTINTEVEAAFGGIGLEQINSPTYGSSGNNYGDYYQGDADGTSGTDKRLLIDPLDTSDYDLVQIGTNDFTISTWFNIDTLVTGFQSLVVMGAGNGTVPGFAQTVRNDGTLWMMMADGTTRPQRSASGVVAGTWHWGSGSVDRDGNLFSKRDVSTVGQASAAGADGIDIQSAEPFYIGYGFQELSAGKIGQVMLHHRLLTSSEENYIFNSGNGRSTTEILTATGI